MTNYGGAPAVTYGNAFHLGNNSPRPGADLIPDLMNGVVFYRGMRYYISSLDLAILADSGVPVVIPPFLLSQPKLVGGAFEFNVFGPVGRTNRIDFSTNLVNWTVLTNFITTNATTTVRDVVPPDAARRFYRAVLF